MLSLGHPGNVERESKEHAADTFWDVGEPHVFDLVPEFSHIPVYDRAWQTLSGFLDVVLGTFKLCLFLFGITPLHEPLVQQQPRPLQCLKLLG